MALTCRDDLPDGASEIFFAEGLDRKSRAALICPSAQVEPSWRGATRRSNLFFVCTQDCFAEPVIATPHDRQSRRNIRLGANEYMDGCDAHTEISLRSLIDDDVTTTNRDGGRLRAHGNARRN